MATSELRPAALSALRRHRWAAVGLAIGGLSIAVGMSVLLVLLATKRTEEGGSGGGWYEPHDSLAEAIANNGAGSDPAPATNW